MVDLICLKPGLSSLWLCSQSYDANGNRRSMTRDNLTLLALYDQEDRLLSYGDLVFEYNDHGDLKKKTNTDTGEVTAYTYNQLGQLTQVSLPDSRQITYTIDGEGKRQAKKINGTVETYYIYDLNGRLTAELNPSGSLRSHFVYATQNHSPDLMIKYGVTYRFAKDHLGSIRAVINTQTGEVAQQINCDEFGVVTDDSNPGYQPLGFAGGHYDSDTKLVRFGARDYDAETGRFLTRDPILFAGGDPNLYSYVFQDPVNLIDPLGLYGTRDCGYYTGRCADSGGNYYCTIAPAACDWFHLIDDPNPDEGWTNCTRQCLQDEDRKHSSNQNMCPSSPDESTDEFWDPVNTDAHVKCYTQCLINRPK